MRNAEVGMRNRKYNWGIREGANLIITGNQLIRKTGIRVIGKPAWYWLL